MNAQITSREYWAIWFADWRDPFATKYQRRIARNRMKRIRREAALERQIAAQQRHIAELEMYQNHLQELLDDANFAVWSSRL